MTRVIGLALLRPRVTLVVWLIATAALGLVGTGMKAGLRQSTLDLPGTPSSKAMGLLADRFGQSVTIPVLLTGEQSEVRRQGKALVEILRRRPATRVLSPFEAGAGPLRPRPGVAMIVVAVDRPLDQAVDEVAPALRQSVDEHIRPPLHAAVTGMPVIAADLKHDSFAAVDSGERIALVALILVLLLVFRTPGAALIPAGFGIATVLSGYGVITLLTHVVKLDVVAGTLTTMMGLALGVDYSLLLVSRFREELAHGRAVPDAARTAGQTAGRTVLFAGGALSVAMVVALLLAPGDLLLSAATGVLVTTLLSMLAAATAVPALLNVLGTGIERWALPGRRDGRGVAGLAAVLLRRPRIVAGLLLIALIALATPTTGLQTGPPDVGQLAANSRALRDFKTVKQIMGPGWASSFEIAVATRRGTITDAPHLRAIDRFQAHVADDHDVAVVIGPGELSKRLGDLRGARGQLRRAQRDAIAGRRGALHLQRGLQRASSGVSQLRQGLSSAASGANRLASGSGRGADGARRVHAALAQAAAGARQLRAGLRAARSGTTRLRHGASRAAAGQHRLARALRTLDRRVAASVPDARRLADGLQAGADDLGRLREPAQITQTQVQQALDDVKAMTVGKADPRYVRTLLALSKASAAASGRDPITGARLDPRYDGLAAAMNTATDGAHQAADGASRLADGTTALAGALTRIRAGADRLDAGLGSLDDGAARLERGLHALDAGGGHLAGGLSALRDGTDRLAAGLARLDYGARRLSSGLDHGAGKTAQLRSGLDRAEHGTQRFADRLDSGPSKRVRVLQERSPGFLSSGYLGLAAIDGAGQNARTAATFAVNLDRGGNAGRILVIPRSGPTDAKTDQLRQRLQRSAGVLAARSGMLTGVGGTAALLSDYATVTSSSLLVLIATLAAISYVLLLIIVRSVLLALIAVALNLLTVGVCFGLLALLFQGSAPLGGPGYIDAVAISAIYTVIFGLSIDYEVFLLTRMRESWLATGDGEAAILYGLDRTARVVTGAASIMVAVFLAFSNAPVANVRQFGVGLAIAVTLDATVIRLGILPALMKLAGRWCWWMPGWLDRALPHLDPDGADNAADGREPLRPSHLAA